MNPFHEQPEFEEQLRRRAVELVTGEIAALLSSWARTRDLRGSELDLAAADAIDLLAAYAHLDRFAKETLPPDILEEVAPVVESDGAIMASLVGEGLSPSGWLEEASALEEATDSVSCDEDVCAVREMALRLFRELDTAELACLAAKKIGRAEDISDLVEALAECGEVFVWKSDLFQPVADYARAMLAAYRSDLMGADRDLFVITEKYRLLVDEDVLVPFSQTEAQVMTQEGWAELSQRVLAARIHRPELSWPEEHVPLAAAADAEAAGGILGHPRIHFAAEDRSWSGYMEIPSSVHRHRADQESIALWLDDDEGPIQEGQVILCGREFQIGDGRAIIRLRDLRDLWEKPTEADTIRLRRGERESVGIVEKVSLWGDEMIAIDDTALAKAAHCALPLEPAHALRLVQDFGSAALWMLKPDVIRTALEDPCFPSEDRQGAEGFISLPCQPANAGAANPIFVVRPDELGVTQEALRQSALREAFFLPLVWQSGAVDDGELPAQLIDLARQVRHDLGMDGSAWGLRGNASVGLDRADLSHLNLSCSSAWGALASALRLADECGRPQAHVAVSAAWAPGKGIQDVESVVEKCQVAAEFGCTVFFASPAQAERLRVAGAQPEGIELRLLQVDQTEPGPALGELLHELEAIPRRADGADIAVRKRYANGAWGRDREGREKYILHEITDDLADEIRSQPPTARALHTLEAIDRQVVVASSSSATRLSVRLLKPKRVLVLYTDQYRNSCGGSPRDHLVAAGTPSDIEERRVEPEDFKSIVCSVREFVRGGGRSVVDVTGGKKGMSAAAAIGGCEAGAAVVFIDSENLGLGGHEVGSEELRIVWPVPTSPDAPTEPVPQLTTIFVTRHAGAREWASRQGIQVDRVADHLEPAELQPGDTVIGTLPVNLAAEVRARGARYLHLVLPLPTDCRGKELTAADMVRLGAHVREFRVEEARGGPPCTWQNE